MPSKTFPKSQVLKKVCFCQHAILDPCWPSTTGLVSWLECQTKMGLMNDSSGPDTENGGGGTPNIPSPERPYPKPCSVHSRSSMEGESEGRVR